MLMNRYFLILAFASILLAPIVNDVFSIVHFKRAAENRTFHDSLSLNFKRLDAFPKDCEAYIDDNFAFRSPFIQLYQTIKTSFFKVPPTDKETVLMGKNNRYFIAGYEKKLFEGEATLTQTQLDSIVKEWNRRNAIYQKSHVKTFWLIAPSALETYSKDLPNNVMKFNANNVTTQMIELLNSKHPNLMIYPNNELQELAKNQNLYFKLDNHWNEMGAYFAIKSLFRNIKQQQPSFNSSFMLDTLHTIKTKKGGYLADQLHQPFLSEQYQKLQLKVTHATLAEKFNFPVTVGFPYPNDFEIHYKNPKAKNKKKVLIIRDSFGKDCIPIIAEAFSETLFIFDSWKFGMNQEIMDAYQPDMVIYITYEPHLINFIR